MNFFSRGLDRAFSLPFNAPVSGLHPARIYNAVEINLPEVDSTRRLAADAIRRQTGADWMAKGIPPLFTRACDSAAILLDSKSNPASNKPSGNAAYALDKILVLVPYQNGLRATRGLLFIRNEGSTAAWHRVGNRRKRRLGLRGG